MNLTAKIFLALVAGLAVGAVLPDVGGSDAVLAIAEPLGNLWLQALQMTIIPLIAGLLFTGIAESIGTAGGGKVAAAALFSFLVLLLFSATWAILFVPALLEYWPAPLQAAAALTGAAPGAVAAGPINVGDWLLSLVPANVFKVLAAGDMLPVVVFVAAFALAAGQLPARQQAPLLAFFDALKDAMLVLVGWIFVAAPIGVFALALTVGLKAGIGAFGVLAHYVAVLVLVQVTLILLVYGLMALFGGGGIAGMGRFARAVLPAQAVAVSTQSSIAALPAIYEGAERLALPESVSRVVLPLAVSIFRITSPCANIAVVLYVGHLNGIAPGPLALAAGVIAALAAAVSTGGLPGSITFLAATVPIANAMGVPVAALPLLLAVELLPDIFRTLGNVTADLAVTSILSKRLKLESAPAPV
ncbi:dicarboxylate/amino acid:cation symporter [Polymorphobacter fuscus]|uniref:Cation:dicarboxylase symporter family transporter n=1 Tax=Sandarakinorhabdus fusca TaxID=1439888 RepID=A0A7C9KJ36_9SPHN|nr:cation:dicarboxylase symporter family transporter [Polymorphobacter fuscus]KAB7645592.1 dicarboxylate/amino acid:cation symporter [Polymorphobacter fuscus]MQT18040.1 cation:dicarboxylase symporter family transporter [Polymorphobacter fuscus]NJC08673.1 Na+/H+-dicarboxylate symporter [Polymorphobacter fuscus]